MGNIFIAGYTESDTGIATTGAFQTSFLGGAANGDSYLAKFTPSGSRMWSTYYGGNNGDYIFGINLDQNNNVFICGGTSSTNNISTLGTTSTIGNGFLAKFTNGGGRVWGTYYPSLIKKITCDNLGDIYAVGITHLSTGIATSGVHQTTFGGGNDAFISMFINSTGLPVKLISFNGYKANQDDVILNWQTLIEVNNDRFEIERAFDLAKWDRIATIKGSGNKQNLSKYLYSDRNVFKGNSSNVYYRLKQIDFDGTFEYSQVIKISKNEMFENILIANPVESELNITIRAISEANVIIQIVDLSGKVKYRSNQNLSIGENRILINAEGLSKGMFLLHLLIDENVIIKKIIKE
jgi:hypothetical protein